MAKFATLTAFLDAPSTKKIVLFEVTGKRSGGADSVTEYWATEDFSTLPTDTPANREYKGLVWVVPEIRRSMQRILSGEGNAVGFPSFADLELINHKKELDSNWGSGGYSAEGWAVRSEIAGESEDLDFADRGLVFLGVGGRHVLDDFRMTLPITDNQAEFEKSIATAVITAADYPNAPAASIGLFKYEIWGEVRWVRPILVDDTAFTYLVTGHSVEDILNVRSNGTVLTITVDYTVNKTASGGATFTLTSNPNNAEIRCDVKGYRMQNTGADYASRTYSARVGDLFEDIILRKTGLVAGDFNSTALSDFKTDAPYDVGIVFREPTIVLDAVNELLKGIPVWTDIDRDGLLVITLLSVPSGAAALTFADDIEVLGKTRIEIITPILSADIGYDNVEDTMSPSSFAGTVSLATIEHGSREVRNVRADNSGVVSEFPLAKPFKARTRILGSADAQTVADLWKTLRGVRREILTVPLGAQPLSVQLGSVVDFKRDRLGLDPTGSNLWRIAAMQERLGREHSKVTVELWQ